MLSSHRKQSLLVPAPGDVLLADYGPDDTLYEKSDIDWVSLPWVRQLFRFTALLSLVSVSMNTPTTFELSPQLIYITFGFDLCASLLYTVEMIAKIYIRGAFSGERPYFRDKWCRFDAIMLLFLWISLALHVFQILFPVQFLHYAWVSVLRAPRPLIMIRFIRIFLRFNLPKDKVNSIVKRASEQISNVTLFFLFFMSLYGIVGVQFFGPLEHHCVVVNSTSDEEVRVTELQIPDQFCSPYVEYGYQCPSGLECIRLRLDRHQRGYSGFDEFLTSTFTVYQAASQEGWVSLMYRTIDSLPAWRGFIYFMTLIFFLAWLVKNVFIAVIAETFADIRSSVQQMWGSTGPVVDPSIVEVLVVDERGRWRLETVDENRPKGPAPIWCQNFLRSNSFHLGVLFLVLANAVVCGCMVFRHDGKDWSGYYRAFYIAEIAFTILFDLEALFKIWCLGLAAYWKRNSNKFELFLAISTTIHCLPSFYRSQLTYFQVLRICRLIKASPMLEDFVHKIFGPGRKLGSLIVFTMCLLIITSSISMQLFCSLLNFPHFLTFPRAFMSMFQILTQEGWIDIMDETMNVAGQLAPVVALYFVIYHLFVTLIVLSLFVAVILDNLELDEEIKKFKQMKAREMSAGTHGKLPMRLRIFEKFPNRPQMVKLDHMPPEFAVPKIKQSFMRQFCNPEFDEAFLVPPDYPPSLYPARQILPLISTQVNMHIVTPQEIQASITALIRDSNRRRMLQQEGSANARGQVVQLIRNRFDRARSMRHSGARPGAGGASNAYRSEPFASAAAAAAAQSAFDSGGGGGDENSHRRTDDLDYKLLQQKRLQAEIRRQQQEEELRENHPFFDTPLFTVGRESRFRKFCQTLVYARYDATQRDTLTGKEIKPYKGFLKLIGMVSFIDWLSIIITASSCFCMMFETPTRRISNNLVLSIAEYCFVAHMSLEIGLKVLADGFIFTPKALIRDYGGLLDLFIYSVSLVHVIWQPAQVPPNSFAQVLMILRCARPLRLFILVPHMRQVIVELFRGFKEIFLVSVLLAVLMYAFASFGVQLFGGKLARCNDPGIKRREDCTGVFWRPLYVTKLRLQTSSYEDIPKLLVPRVWANPRNFDFDALGHAFLALFEILSYKGWLDIRDVLIARQGLVHSIYVHIYVFLGCMIGLTLFVGVVIANYSENRGTALLTVDQRRWCDLRKRIKIAQPLHLPPRPEHSRIRAYTYDLTQSKWFKRFYALLVLVNSILLFVPWSEHYGSATAILTSVFVALNLLFMFECIAKMIAFSAHGFWRSRRNRYELMVSVIGIAWIAAHFIWMNHTTNSFGFVVAILRFFTITGKQATLTMLMMTVAVSMVKSLFIIMGMFLLIQTYAVAGVILFGSVKHGDALGRHANFQSAFVAMTVLFRITTGEDWNDIMHDCMVEPPFCTANEPPDRVSYWQTDCGNFTAAVMYFCSFYVIITYIVLNLLVAIIIENFSLFYSSEEDAILGHADIREFQLIWNLVDIMQKGSIQVRRVPFVLRLILLTGRFQRQWMRDANMSEDEKQKARRLFLKHMCHEMERLHAGGDVTFHDVLNMLSYCTVEIRKSLQFEELLARQELEYTIEEEVAKATIKHWLDRCLRKIRQKHQGRALMSALRAQNEALFDSRERSSKDATAAAANTHLSASMRRRRKLSSARAGSIIAPAAAMDPDLITSVDDEQQQQPFRTMASALGSSEEATPARQRRGGQRHLLVPGINSLDESGAEKLDESAGGGAASGSEETGGGYSGGDPLTGDGSRDELLMDQSFYNTANNSKLSYPQPEEIQKRLEIEIEETRRDFEASQERRRQRMLDNVNARNNTYFNDGDDDDDGGDDYDDEDEFDADDDDDDDDDDLDDEEDGEDDNDGDDD